MKYVYFLAITFLTVFTSCSNENPNKKEQESTIQVSGFTGKVRLLKSAGLLARFDSTQVDSLAAIFEKQKVNGLADLLKLSGDLTVIDATIRNNDIRETYKIICDSISKLVPSIKLSATEAAYLPEEPGGKDTGWVKLSLRLDSVNYIRKMYYFENWPIDNFVYRIFNSRLTDKNAPERLYLVDFELEQVDTTSERDFLGSLDVTRFGLLKLNREQADKLGWMEDLFGVEAENEFMMWSTAATSAYINKFEKSGLIGAADKKWFSLRKDEILMSSLYGDEDFYDYMDTLFVSLNFDTIIDFNPYEEILTSLAAISREQFVPGDIVDEVSSNPEMHFLRFNIKSKNYQYQMRRKNGLHDPNIIDLANQALEENNIPGAFYTVFADDKRVSVIYIEDEKLNTVKASGIFSNMVKGSPSELKSRYQSSLL
ncbi:MAG: hypothetical protein LW750_05505 [Bacteroidetes bacterium]|nr:hypothetical protein [Bacteroidota bacterium]